MKKELKLIVSNGEPNPCGRGLLYASHTTEHTCDSRADRCCAQSVSGKIAPLKRPLLP